MTGLYGLLVMASLIFPVPFVFVLLIVIAIHATTRLRREGGLAGQARGREVRAMPGGTAEYRDVWTVDL